VAARPRPAAQGPAPAAARRGMRDGGAFGAST
jgi:hypothetical protein